MKKVIAFLIIITVILCACGSNGYYDRGYEDGYDDGHSDASWEHDDDLSRGYEFGYEDGYRSGYKDGQADYTNELYNASDYVRDITGWSVYEAWNSLGLYSEDPSCLTKAEYQECVQTLILFCEYLDGIKFE